MSISDCRPTVSAAARGGSKRQPLAGRRRRRGASDGAVNSRVGPRSPAPRSRNSARRGPPSSAARAGTPLPEGSTLCRRFWPLRGACAHPLPRDRSRRRSPAAWLPGQVPSGPQSKPSVTGPQRGWSVNSQCDRGAGMGAMGRRGGAAWRAPRRRIYHRWEGGIVLSR